MAIPFLAVQSQDAPPRGFQYWAADSLQTATKTLTADAATDPHHFAVEQMADFPNDSFILVHRQADGQAELHETQVDVMFIQIGSATLVVGGTPHQLLLEGAHEINYFVVKVKGYWRQGYRRRALLLAATNFASEAIPKEKPCP